jgi:RNA polymerase sigma-70 factor, ECF subfamily
MLPMATSPERQISPDLALAKAVLDRDRKAAAEFVQQLTGPVHQFVFRRLFPRTNAVDDLVQEILFAGWRGLSRYQGESSLTSWILGIARFKVADHYRAILRDSVGLGDESEGMEVVDSAPPPDKAADLQSHAETAAEILAGLKEEYRLVLRWRYWDESSAREMAKELGRSEKSVERLLARARAAYAVSWAEKKGAGRHG